MPRVTNLYGLVLAGGRSRRMGRDKATLVYRGKLQLDRAVQLLKPFCEDVYVSLRADQENPSTLCDKLVVDRFGEIGPLGGLLSAFFYHRKQDLFVISCSMPFLDFAAVQVLLEQRDRNAVATVFAGSDGSPEALFGIYENASKDIFLREAKNGVRDLDDILTRHPCHCVPLEEPGLLDTVDSGTQYYDAQKRIIGV
mgnify:FL=1